jgi:hypothetical protein
VSAWPRPRRVPFWFELALLGVFWLVAHLAGLDARDPGPVAFAWFAWLVIVAQAIWTGVQAVGQATLVALTWAVNALWLTAKAIGTGMKEFGRLFLRGGKELWGFMRATWTHVLKPVWMKFWRLVDWARRGLEDLFRPILRVLKYVRTEWLKLYDRFVRPVLDTIAIARKALRVGSALGLDWATKLDAKLGGIEAWIDAQFQKVLAEINKVINLVDRVVSADGLFQRLALVRSIERDIRYVSRAFMNWRSAAVADEDYARMRTTSRVPTIDDVLSATTDALTTNSGRYAPFVSETVAQWRIDLERR